MLQVGLCSREGTGSACGHPSRGQAAFSSDTRNIRGTMRDLCGQESSWRLQSPRSLVGDRGQHLSCHQRFDNSAQCCSRLGFNPRTIPFKSRAVPGPAQFVLTCCTGGTGQDLCEGTGAAAQTTAL